ncbi:MAG: DUF456 domain-containing protein [Sphingobacteriales bacterium]|nr:MAG: DUF456 domain-containing protein [Sphingobacteriales bacterium]
MELVLVIIAIILTLAGLAGCVLPAIPGPPLNFIGLLLLQWAWQPFSTITLVALGIITIIVLVLDYMIPVWGAKIFGATRYGIWGSIIGMLAGIFLTPIGMIMGLLLGAIIGDMLAGKKPLEALKSGAGTFLGTMAGMLVKLIVAGIMTFLAFYEIIKYGWTQFSS